MSKYLASEMCQTMNTHWGIGKDDFCYLSPKEVIEDLMNCRKVGFNLLLNIGLTASGKIPTYEYAVLQRVGDWVDMYADVIYYAKPSKVRGGKKDFVLALNDKLYLCIFGLPADGDHNVVLAGGDTIFRSFSNIDKTPKNIKWIDNNEQLEFTINAKDNFLTVKTTAFPYGTNYVVRIAEVDF